MKLVGRFMAAGALVASGWVAQDYYTDIKDDAACAKDAWECSTNVSRVISEERFRFADKEDARIKGIFKEMGVGDAALNACDRAIANGLSLITAEEMVRDYINSQVPREHALPSRTGAEIALAVNASIEEAPRGFMCATTGELPDYFAKPRPEFVGKFVAPFNR